VPRVSRAVVVVDTGLGSAAAGIALDRQWLAAHARGERPNLLRLYRTRPAALIGHHQCAAEELRGEYCRRAGIAVARRNTGGGAIYVDEQQFAWTLIVQRTRPWRTQNLSRLLETFCSALGAALAQLGVQARFKTPNDLEVDGRKIASGYIATAGDSLLFHGTILCDVDVGRTLSALRVPTEKLSPDGLAGARQRLTTLLEQRGGIPTSKELRAALSGALLEALGLTARKATKSLYAALREAGDGGPPSLPHEIAIEPDEAAEDHARALWQAPGGLLRVRLGFDAGRRQLRSVSIKGDLFAQPADVLCRLEASLRGVPLPEIEQRVTRFFEENEADIPGITPRDIWRALERALHRTEQQRQFGLSEAQANRLMVLGAADNASALDILNAATAMLVPYCAKPPECSWRNRDGCPECGRCEVGEAYALGRSRGMRIVSINNFEHLCATLGELRADGVRGLIGMCCENFFIKRQYAFRASGIPMVLMDISGSNCYELGQEEQAYAGGFQAQSTLDMALLHRVIRHVPTPSRDAPPTGGCPPARHHDAAAARGDHEEPRIASSEGDSGAASSRPANQTR
jgi:lipoate---protein ligase